MEITLPNGVKINGKAEDISEILSKMGIELDETLYYYSDSRMEYVRITDMVTMHLRNAILKIYANWVARLRDSATPREMVALMKEGHISTGFVALVAELSKRESFDK